MKYKRKFILILILCSLIIILRIVSKSENFISFYNINIYRPLQAGRGYLFNGIGISVGDALYFLFGLLLSGGAIKLIVYTFKFKKLKHKLFSSLLTTAIKLLAVVIYFLLGWGINYSKPSLANFWQLGRSKAINTVDLIEYNRLILEKLNMLAPKIQYFSFSQINNQAKNKFSSATGNAISAFGLRIKPTFYGYLMERVGIEGYYNPFTGEGQANSQLPNFLLPFVICHEMAHQVGIAAENDANLLAYTICTEEDDPTFNYSAYLTIWQFTYIKLYRIDSTKALSFEKQLNPETKAHLDTIEVFREKCDNYVAEINSKLYDSYLKTNNQKEGIRSYRSVVNDAWQIELRRHTGCMGLIKIP